MFNGCIVYIIEVWHCIEAVGIDLAAAERSDNLCRAMSAIFQLRFTQCDSYQQSHKISGIVSCTQ